MLLIQKKTSLQNMQFSLSTSYAFSLVNKERMIHPASFRYVRMSCNQKHTISVITSHVAAFHTSSQNPEFDWQLLKHSNLFHYF